MILPLCSVYPYGTIHNILPVANMDRDSAYVVARMKLYSLGEGKYDRQNIPASMAKTSKGLRLIRARSS